MQPSVGLVIFEVLDLHDVNVKLLVLFILSMISLVQNIRGKSSRGTNFSAVVWKKGSASLHALVCHWW